MEKNSLRPHWQGKTIAQNLRKVSHLSFCHPCTVFLACTRVTLETLYGDWTILMFCSTHVLNKHNNCFLPSALSDRFPVKMVMRSSSLFPVWCFFPLWASLINHLPPQWRIFECVGCMREICGRVVCDLSCKTFWLASHVEELFLVYRNLISETWEYKTCILWD